MGDWTSRRWRRWLAILAAIVLVYGALAYVLLPAAWRHYEHQRGLAQLPMVTRTAQGIAGDPLNVGLVGDKAEVLRLMNAAGWYPADPITLRSSIEIAGSVVLDRPYHDAPVSSLYYDGRKQDLAFEKPIGASADRRNHVRFWLVLEKGEEGRPVWLGSATLDEGVGLSHYTGQITHHIAPDIDDERDTLIADLIATRMVATIYTVSGVGPTLNGRNGEDDRYYTDGEMKVAVIAPGAIRQAGEVEVLEEPMLVSLKNSLWRSAASFAGQ
jgi:hypothetical protein